MSRAIPWLAVALALLSSAHAFSPAAARLPRLATPSAPLVGLPVGPAAGACAQQSREAPHSRDAVPMPRAAAARSRLAEVQMGLFGLGLPEIGVIALVVLFVVGPDRLAPYAKQLGSSAGGLKEITDSFSEGLKEGAVNADSLKSADGEGPVITAKVAPKEGEAS